jgi:hypothetical protein
MRRLALALVAALLSPAASPPAGAQSAAVMSFHSSILSFGYQWPYCTSGTGPGAPLLPTQGNSSVFCRVSGASTSITVDGLVGGVLFVDATYIVDGPPGPLGYRSGTWAADSLALSQEFELFRGSGPSTLEVDMAIANAGGVAFVLAKVHVPSWWPPLDLDFLGNGVVTPNPDAGALAVSGGQIVAYGLLTGI